MIEEEPDELRPSEAVMRGGRRPQRFSVSLALGEIPYEVESAVRRDVQHPDISARVHRLLPEGAFIGAISKRNLTGAETRQRPTVSGARRNVVEHAPLAPARSEIISEVPRRLLIDVLQFIETDPEMVVGQKNVFKRVDRVFVQLKIAVRFGRLRAFPMHARADTNDRRLATARLSNIVKHRVGFVFGREIRQSWAAQHHANGHHRQRNQCNGFRDLRYPFLPFSALTHAAILSVSTPDDDAGSCSFPVGFDNAWKVAAARTHSDRRFSFGPP